MVIFLSSLWGVLDFLSRFNRLIQIQVRGIIYTITLKRRSLNDQQFSSTRKSPRNRCPP
jgi:hypothetical protein